MKLASPSDGYKRTNKILLIILTVATVVFLGMRTIAESFEWADQNAYILIPCAVASCVGLVTAIVGIPLSLAGLVCSRRAPRAAVVAGVNCLASLAFVIGLCIYPMVTPHPEFTTEPLSLSEFKKRFGHGEELPASATNILFAASSRGIGGRARLYRFDAPVADCTTYGKHLLQKSNEDRISGLPPVGPDLVPLTSSPPPVQKEMYRAYGLTKVDWFDVETIRSGFEGKGPPYGLAHFWIDTDRGRFYYFWTD